MRRRRFVRRRRENFFENVEINVSKPNSSEIWCTVINNKRIMLVNRKKNAEERNEPSMAN
jgi:hypothetical protein